MGTKKTKLFIAFPYYNGVDGVFFSSYTVFCHECDTIGVDIAQMIQGGDSLISRQRNYMTRRFLESDATHMMFIDTDIVFSAQQVKRIVENMDKVDICGGIYLIKSPTIPPRYVYNTLDDVSKMETRGDTMAEVKYTGTGFLCISRNVFNSIRDRFRDEIEYVPDNDPNRLEWDFWRVGVCKYKDRRPRYLSEDWYFCEMAKRCGYKIYVDQSILLKHHGQITYPTPEQEKFIMDNLPKEPSAVPSECFEVDTGAGKTVSVSK